MAERLGFMAGFMELKHERRQLKTAGSVVAEKVVKLTQNAIFGRCCMNPDKFRNTNAYVDPAKFEQPDLACSLRSKPMLACKAADACAEGSIVGVGGWFISSNSVSWFAETWQFQEVQEQWPCLTKEAQRYIACFETLAQLALMRIAWSCEGQSVHGICMPTGTDNTASEAGVNKLFTTAWPLQVFVQLVAAWAHKHKWSVIASHIPGEINIWADQLSRGNTSAFQA